MIHTSYSLLIMKIILFVFILVVNNVYGAVSKIDPLVLIEQGLVRGQKVIGGNYASFLGVPYAQVDLNNPFGPAQPHPDFNGEIFNAYDGSIKCPQNGNDDESLDCLRLNIFVPDEANSRNPLPVLVWVHGGVFEVGNGGKYDVRDLVRYGIVVVTINYRLGPYGFLCLDVPTVSGNQGLKDQYVALQWIRKNIAAFGGNPYNVTLAGQSAGAASVLLHLYSVRDKLYNKIIAESNTPQSDGLFVDGDIDAALKLATHLGLNSSDTEEALDFLAKTPHNLVIAATKELELQMRPCKERSFSGIQNFVENDPYSLSNVNKVKNTPVLIGHTTAESVGIINVQNEDYLKSDPFYTRIRNNFNLNDDDNNKISKIVRQFYIGDSEISINVASELTNFESDFIFNHPIQRAITNLINENANPIFEYLFSYVEDSETTGAAHSEELKYLFNNYTAEREESQLIAERITNLWTNFVKFGNPTPTVTDLIPVFWEPVNANTRPYLVIDTDIRVEYRVLKERMAFWDLFYINYGRYSYLARECTF